MYSNVYDNKFINIKELIDNSEFEKAYNTLKSISERCSKWYYLNSLSAMNLGYYEEGENSIIKASEMEPENKDYKSLLESYNFYRDNYRERSYNYNRRRHADLGGCCCCCCDDCCEDCMKLWCLDSCCECFGGDLVSCF